MWWMQTQLFFSPLLLHIPNSFHLSKPLTKECSQCFVLCILKNLSTQQISVPNASFWHFWKCSQVPPNAPFLHSQNMYRGSEYIYRYHQVLDKTFHHHQTLKMDLKPFPIKLIWFVWGLFLCLLWMVQEGCFLGSRNHSWTSTTWGSQKNCTYRWLYSVHRILY